MADLPRTPPATQDPAVPQSTIPFSTPAPTALTADALQVFLTHVLQNLPTGVGVQTTASPTAVPLPQKNLPPFHSTTATVVPPGQSIYDLFPLIETSTILDITKHIFKPLDLFKLDPTMHDKNMVLKTVLDFNNRDGTISTKVQPGSLRDYYPCFSSLVEPLTIYFDILSAYAASSGNVAATYAIVTGGFHYIRHLSTLNRSYHWDAVLQYHKAFFMLRCRDMLRGDYTGWARSDGQLMNSYLYHQVRSSAVDSSKPSRMASSSSTTLVSSEICHSFNMGACTTSPCPSGRIHQCQKCDAVALVLRSLRRQLRSMAGQNAAQPLQPQLARANRF